MTAVALSAPPLIKWLLQTEPDVHRAVLLFLTGRADTNEIPVAGPPVASELLRARRDAAYRPRLPQITLTCRMVSRLDEQGVEITCSELDMIKLETWHNEGKLRAAMPRGIGLK